MAVRPGLLASYRRVHDRLTLHDVIRGYLRTHTKARRGELDAAIVDTHRGLLPPEGRWADLPGEHAYLWSWLAAHLYGAGLVEELHAVLTDARWLIAKLEHIGPAGLEADLRLGDLEVCQGWPPSYGKTPPCSAPWTRPGRSRQPSPPDCPTTPGSAK